MSFGSALQTAIHSALAGDTDLADAIAEITLPDGTKAPAVMDHVIQPSDTGSDSRFPYITIGDDLLSNWDTDSELGADADITLHVWSRYRGRAEVKEIQGLIYDILHRCDLTIQGYRSVMIDWVDDTSFMDPDGLTRHGVSQYRVLLESN